MTEATTTLTRADAQPDAFVRHHSRRGIVDQVRVVHHLDARALCQRSQRWGYLLPKSRFEFDCSLDLKVHTRNKNSPRQ